MTQQLLPPPLQLPVLLLACQHLLQALVELLPLLQHELQKACCRCAVVSPCHQVTCSAQDCVPSSWAIRPVDWEASLWLHAPGSHHHCLGWVEACTCRLEG